MEVGIKEVRDNLSELLKRVEAGEQVTITRRGRPVARLVPDQSELPPLDRSAFRERLSRKGHNLAAAVRKDREEVRY